jgi:glycosyltransferase A (GT-A) superfamily protein (DUF2064 family)
MAVLPHGRRHLGLVLLTKAPAPGLAKRRLGGQIGAERAAQVARVLLGNTVDACLAVGVPVHGFYRGSIDELPRNTRIAWRPSAGENPVSAVLAAFRELIRGYYRLIAVPSDVPAMTSTYLAAADDALNRADVVLGPSWDGGLVLFGAACELPDELSHVPASSGRLFTDVLRCCTEHGLTVETLPGLTDIDSWSSISRAIDEGELLENSVLHTQLLSAMQASGPPAGDDSGGVLPGRRGEQSSKMPREVCLVVEAHGRRHRGGWLAGEQPLPGGVQSASGEVAVRRQAEGRREGADEVVRMGVQEFSGLAQGQPVR